MTETPTNGDEPKHIGEVTSEIKQHIGEPPDIARVEEVRAIDLAHEEQGLEEELQSLLHMVALGAADNTTWTRLDEVRTALHTARADRGQGQPKPNSGNLADE